MRGLLPMVLIAGLACSDATAPKPAPIDHPPTQTGPFDSYAAAPCAGAIAADIAAWRPDYGEPVAITLRTSGDTTTVRVSLDAPAEYSELYEGTVWQEYSWLSSSGYCTATRSIGMPDA